MISYASRNLIYLKQSMWLLLVLSMIKKFYHLSIINLMVHLYFIAAPFGKELWYYSIKSMELIAYSLNCLLNLSQTKQCCRCCHLNNILTLLTRSTNENITLLSQFSPRFPDMRFCFLFKFIVFIRYLNLYRICFYASFHLRKCLVRE